MENVDVGRSMLIVAGMHRSGTSLTASLLQNAGVNMGQRLMEANPGNVKGYFENLDFVEFHQMVLRSQGLSESGWVIQGEATVEELYTEKAKKLVYNSSLSPIWGWKDPRTTLFLEFWANLLPEANFILVYRSPWEVADSLYRRSVRYGEVFLDHPDLAIKVWIHYNQKILEFHQKYSKRCLLRNLEQITRDTPAFFADLNRRFHLHLTPPETEIYDRTILNTQVSDTYRPSLVNQYFPEALEIYRQLHLQEAEPDHPPDLTLIDRVQTHPYRISAFQDWINVRCLEVKSKELHEQLVHAQTQLQQTQAELAQSHLQAQQSQGELAETQTQLRHMQTQLVQIQDSVTQLQQSAQQTQLQLAQNQAQLVHTENQQQQLQIALQQVTEKMVWMENTRTWKLRSYWLKVRKRLGFDS
ncbi:MAG: sulfotransferase [Scytolyngbya sp. HA4215-MV1]|nr:sulfotransferase [Scytolyngbya sp. HA4215-MV1]